MDRVTGGCSAVRRRLSKGGASLQLRTKACAGQGSWVLEHIQDLQQIFSEAARTLRLGGSFFLNELHPFRQYEGTRARFYRSEEKVEVDAFIHHTSDFLKAARQNHLLLVSLDEYWHETDQNRPPRLLSLYF